MDEGTGQQADGGFERHPVRVLIRDEEVGHIRAHSWMHIPSDATEEAEGHGWKFEAGKDQEGEGQVYVMSVQHESGTGQMSRGSFLGWLDPNDTEGEGVGPARLYPAGADDLEAQGFRTGVLKPELSGSWTLELDDDLG